MAGIESATDDATSTQDGAGTLAEETSTVADSMPTNESVDTSSDVIVDGGTDTVDVADTAVADADSWRAQYEDLGFENLETPEEAQARLVDAFRRERERSAHAIQQARYFQSQATNIGATRPADAAPAAPADQPKDIFGQFTAGWQGVDDVIAPYVQKDEDGKPTWIPGTPQEVINRAHAARIRQKEWDEVISDPRRLQQAINERVEAMLAERLDGALSQRDELTANQRAEQEFFAANDWIFERDPVTRGHATDFDGHPKLSRQGQQFQQALLTVQKAGVTRVADQLDMAMAILHRTQAQQKQSPIIQRQQAATAAAAQRNQMLGRKNPVAITPTVAAGINDGDGAAPTGKSRMSASRQAILELQDEGYAL